MRPMRFTGSSRIEQSTQSLSPTHDPRSCPYASTSICVPWGGLHRHLGSYASGAPLQRCPHRLAALSPHTAAQRGPVRSDMDRGKDNCPSGSCHLRSLNKKDLLLPSRILSSCGLCNSLPTFELFAAILLPSTYLRATRSILAPTLCWNNSRRILVQRLP